MTITYEPYLGGIRVILDGERVGVIVSGERGSQYQPLGRNPGEVLATIDEVKASVESNPVPTNAIADRLTDIAFTIQQMGGGCLALGKDFGEGERAMNVLATGSDGAGCLPEDGDWMIGFYIDADEGEAFALYSSEQGDDLDEVFARIEAMEEGTTLPDPMLLAPMTLGEAMDWIDALQAADLMFHFEDSPETIISGVGGEPTFDKVGAMILRHRVELLYRLDWPKPLECPIGYALTIPGVSQDDEAKLVEEFAGFVDAYSFEGRGDCMELLHLDTLTPFQRRWLSNFSRRWEVAVEGGDLEDVMATPFPLAEMPRVAEVVEVATDTATGLDEALNGVCSSLAQWAETRLSDGATLDSIKAELREAMTVVDRERAA